MTTIIIDFEKQNQREEKMIKPNTTYKRRYLQEVEVISVLVNEEDDTKGSVRYRNEFGAECVMTLKQFEEFYEETKNGNV